MHSTAYPYRVAIAPAGDPLFITTDQARTFLRLTASDITDEDLTIFIRAAQSAAERFTRLTLFTTTFETTRDFFHHSDFFLRRAPLTSITSIERLVMDVLVTVDTTTFKAIDTDVLNYGSIVLKAGQIWPSDQDHEPRAITITFVAGFGADATFLPDDLVEGMKRILSDLYENRGDCGDQGNLSTVAGALLARFKIMTI